jgi:hypothetical protein
LLGYILWFVYLNLWQKGAKMFSDQIVRCIKDLAFVLLLCCMRHLFG